MKTRAKKKKGGDLLVDPAIGGEVEDHHDVASGGDICVCGDPLDRHDEDGVCMTSTCKCERFRLAP
jgi:hypothetical protein